MDKKTNEYLFQLQLQKSKRFKVAIVMLLLSLVVAIAVAWNLRLDGITMSGDPLCGIEDHEHTAICYSDKTADVESPADWESALPKPGELTGVWGQDLAKVAKTQLGYQESTKNYDVTEDGALKGYTRYGQWQGNPYGGQNRVTVRCDRVLEE